MTTELLAWLDSEQKKPDRWIRNDQGVLRFTLTGPELQRIRAFLAVSGSGNQATLEPADSTRGSEAP